MNFQIADIRVTLPASWHQVSLGQLLTIRGIGQPSGRNLSTLEVIAILSGQPLPFWQAVNPDDIASKVMPYLEWSNEYFDWNSLPVPEWFCMGEAGPSVWMPMVMCVPMNLDLESYGQKVFIESLIGNEKMSDAERVPMVLAAYFEPIYSGLDGVSAQFNTERLADFLPIILSTACTEALPIYSFFFLRYSASMHIMAG